MKAGGNRTFIANGKIVDLAEQVEIKTKGEMKFQEAFTLGRKMLLYFKKTCASIALEKYNINECEEVEEVDFREELLKSELNTEPSTQEKEVEVRKV